MRTEWETEPASGSQLLEPRSSSCPQMFMKHGCQVLRDRIPQSWSVMHFINICPTWTSGKELPMCWINPYLDCKPPKWSFKAGSTIVNNLDFISSAMGVDEVWLRFHVNQLKSSDSRNRKKVFHVVCWEQIMKWPRNGFTRTTFCMQTHSICARLDTRLREKEELMKSRNYFTLCGEVFG